MRRSPDQIVYSINVGDLQNVAARVLDRQLSNEELEIVANSVGDFIDWNQAIQNAIEIRLESSAHSS